MYTRAMAASNVDSYQEVDTLGNGKNAIPSELDIAGGLVIKRLIRIPNS